MVKRVTAEQFLIDLQNKFPELPKEQIPSIHAVKAFKKKFHQWRDSSESKSIAIAMKDEFQILTEIQDFNFFRERKKLYEAAVKGLQGILDLMERTANVPTNQLWAALNACSTHLHELDKLAVRFGYMPPMPENKFLGQLDEFFNKKQVSGEIEKDYDYTKFSTTLERVVILQREIAAVRERVKRGDDETSAIRNNGKVIEERVISEQHGQNDGGSVGVQEPSAHQRMVSSSGQPQHQENSVGSTEKSQ